MKIGVIDTKNAELRKIELPEQFQEEFREDLVQRAVIAAQANSRQPFGSKPGAGMRHSSLVSKRRRDFKTSYGHGISRVPRKVLSARGTRFFWVGAASPGTVGGRRAHPPKAEKILKQKLSEFERTKAIRSGLSAILNKEIVKERGHIAPPNYPFALDSSFEKLSKTKELRLVLEKIGLKDELSRNLKRKVSEGVAKIRGRKRRVGKSLLLVVSKDCELSRSARNIEGVNIVPVERLSITDIAPGCMPGRMTLFTEPALEKMKKDRLFAKSTKNKNIVKGFKKQAKKKVNKE